MTSLVSGYWLLVAGSRKPETRSQKPETSSQKPETRTRNQKPEARSQKPETRSQKPETKNALLLGMGSVRSPAMRFLVECRFALIFAAVVTFCSVMVIRQTHFNRSAHSELREAFIILHSRGHTNEAQRLYN